MATFAKLAGVELPTKDREGKPMIFDSYDMSPILFGTGKVIPSEKIVFNLFIEPQFGPSPNGLRPAAKERAVHTHRMKAASTRRSCDPVASVRGGSLRPSASCGEPNCAVLVRM